ncbi:hypothetical protein LN139_11015 [Pseudomonas sp. KNUC1026]|nr:hypothetical protein LN139_11015 [Pseudomonas sp. KNUC1026]
MNNLDPDGTFLINALRVIHRQLAESIQGYLRMSQNQLLLSIAGDFATAIAAQRIFRLARPIAQNPSALAALDLAATAVTVPRAGRQGGGLQLSGSGARR